MIDGFMQIGKKAKQPDLDLDDEMMRLTLTVIINHVQRGDR
jgi:hypothetical protein